MGEVENKKLGNSNKKIAFIKQSTKVDFTTMVDLGFLLITLFCIYNNNIAANCNEF